MGTTEAREVPADFGQIVSGIDSTRAVFGLPPLEEVVDRGLCSTEA